MNTPADRILIIDDDPETRTLLREQVFASSDFVVGEAKDGPDALQALPQFKPDLVVLDLQLPGLSGRDMLVGIKSQGFHGPIIVIAEGRDAQTAQTAIEAFRLGASDFVTRPLRETEVLAAVERGLAEVRLRRDRTQLMTQLQHSNQQLETRIRQLTTLYDIGQSVTAMHNLEGLFDGVLEGALSMTNADHALLLLRDDQSERLILRAGKNLPLAMLDRVGEAVQDQLADLVMTSREGLVVAGDSLRRFAVSRDLNAVAYVPLTIQTNAIGVLAVGNHESQTSFTDEHNRLLRMLADYAAIAIVNARLFRMLEERARLMESSFEELRSRDAQRGRQLQIVLSRLHQPLVEIEAEVNRIAQGNAGKISKDAHRHLITLDQRIRQLVAQITTMAQNQGGS
ncbi:MAG: response regulator [Chloroflexi bacterium]|nr:response regulator [Chloroflexota bacterium]